MDGSNSNKRQVEAQREEESSAKRQIVVTMGLETLKCSSCSQLLKPQIFQCSVGHFICSSCVRVRWHTEKYCYLCNAKTSFKRCVGMEHVVQSVTVPCSNAKHGCTKKLVYHEKEEHEKICPKVPCFCPESGCSFAGPTEALLDHLTAQHKCLITTFPDSDTAEFRLQPGFHVLRCCRNSHFFLLNMSLEPFGHAISVIYVQPCVTGPKFMCDMEYDCFTTGYYENSCCKIRSSSLSNGLPTGYDFILPKGKVYDDENGILLRFTIRGKSKIDDDSDAQPVIVSRDRGKSEVDDDSDAQPVIVSRDRRVYIDKHYTRAGVFVTTS